MRAILRCHLAPEEARARTQECPEIVLERGSLTNAELVRVIRLITGPVRPKARR